MNQISAVRFIIDNLIIEDKLEDYYEWFLAVRDFKPDRRRDDKDNEYERYTHKMIYLYVCQFIPDITFEQIDMYDYFYFKVDRTDPRWTHQVHIYEDFYCNFINEVSLYYNEPKPTLK